QNGTDDHPSPKKRDNLTDLNEPEEIITPEMIKEIQSKYKNIAISELTAERILRSSLMEQD
ncbi:hypothetical protein ACFL7M_14015, partial [Thermodesulfobacteriota bacterium]